MKDEAERPAPFDGRTTASAQYSRIDYEKQINAWFVLLQADKEPPNTEQLAVLHAVRDRILQEIVLSREGPGIWKNCEPRQLQTHERNRYVVCAMVFQARAKAE